MLCLSRIWMHRLIRISAVVAWMGLIFFFSAQPSLPSVHDALLDTVLKKGGHVIGYAVLMVLLLQAAGSQNKPLTVWHVTLCLAILIGYACSDEFHQSFVPGRNASLMDVILFDVPGGLLGLILRFRPVQIRSS
ncbi:MAG: VanZ family protein [Anaerolineae bacterium]|nr:VanZ family protein [Thermoflexales bacterium]MDW8406256.1 VanZ family protein [Anaerolineae bacterium]